MRARYKAPAGTGTVEFDDQATVRSIFEQIQANIGTGAFSLKYGWPPRALEVSDSSAAELRLNGETLTVVPDEAPVVEGTPKKPSGDAPRAPLPSTESPEDITVPWPEREGTLLLRVMPSDNSCLFTAFGGALQRQIPAKELRKMIADFIKAHPDEYTEAILGMNPTKYCRVIQTPDYWGGAIEISIFSTLFDIEIVAFDVKNQNLMRFGEDKESRCILVFSGIHYDRVCFQLSEPPYTVAMLPPEVDRTVWETTDDEILEKTKLLVKKLNTIHYYTDPADILLKCEHPGCTWIGSGEKAGQKHAEETGHVQLEELDDTVLLKCKASRCDWLGTLGEAKKHGVETGHTALAYIPDL